MTRNNIVAQSLDEWLRQAHPGAGEVNIQEILHKCTTSGLDPRLGDVHLIMRGRKLTMQVGIDGFRKTAARTGQLNGCTVEWCGEDGRFLEVWIPQTPPAAARVRVYRKGCDRPFEGVAKWSEYAQPSGLWPKMSALMLSKVSEALALRRGFPDVLGGLYSQEEMDQATGEAPGMPGEALEPVTGAAIVPESDPFDILYAELEATAQKDGMRGVIAALKAQDTQHGGSCPLVAQLRAHYPEGARWTALKTLANKRTVI
jgi:phage recombination protein Bet